VLFSIMTFSGTRMEDRCVYRTKEVVRSLIEKYILALIKGRHMYGFKALVSPYSGTCGVRFRCWS
jgi:hypothetical protein